MFPSPTKSFPEPGVAGVGEVTHEGRLEAIKHLLECRATIQPLVQKPGQCLLVTFVSDIVPEP
jgi:hypothetical protein